MSDSSLRTSVTANFGWLLAERAWRILIGFAVSILITRYLGPRDFGVLSFALSLSAIAGTIVGLGIDDVITRDLVRRPDEAKALLTVAFRLKLVSAVIAMALLLTVSLLFRPGDYEAFHLVVWVAIGMLFLPADLVELWYHSKECMKPPALVRKCALGVTAFLRLGLVLFEAPLWCFAAATALELALISAAFIVLWVRRIEPTFANKRTGPQTVRAGRILREGFPLLVSGFLVVATMHTDRLLLIQLTGEREMGVYAAAARLTELLYVIPMALGAAYAPRLASLYSVNVESYSQTARKALFVVILITFAACAFVTLLSPYGIALALGDPYLPTVEVWKIQIWTLVFIGIVSLRSRLWVIEGHPRWILSISLSTFMLSVAINWYLIPRFGALGAAWSAVLAWGASALVLPWCAAGPARSMWRWCSLAIHK